MNFKALKKGCYLVLFMRRPVSLPEGCLILSPFSELILSKGLLLYPCIVKYNIPM